MHILRFFILFLAGLVANAAHAQTYPSPTFQSGLFLGPVVAKNLQAATLYNAAVTPAPTCNLAAKGTLITVSDATSSTGPYVTGGSVITGEFCNGSIWLSGDANAFTHVANLTALKAWPTTVSPVFRDGYTTAGDAGEPTAYYWSASACSLAAGAGDNGAQVKPNIGSGCWNAAFPTAGVDVRNWGAVPVSVNPSFDSSAAFIAAAKGVSVKYVSGSTKIVIPPTPGGFKVAQAANLDFTGIPDVTIACSPSSFGYRYYGGYTTYSTNLTAPCTLQLNPAYSISTGNNFALEGVRVVNQNIESATDTRSALDAVKSYTGTGILITNVNTILRDVTINGFDLGYYANGASHLRVYNLIADTLRVFSESSCFDCLVSSALTSSSITNPLGISISGFNTTITNVVNNGGFCQITTATQTPNLIVGDKPEIYGIVGTNMPAAGLYTITSIDVVGSQFTINGVCSGASVYTSGGYVTIPKDRRLGVAFEFLGIGGTQGGESNVYLQDYGHTTSVHIGPNKGPVYIDYLWTDGPSYTGWVDPTTVGVDSEGWGGGVYGGFMGIKAKGVWQHSADTSQRPFTINGLSQFTTAGCTNSPQQYPLQIDQGQVLFTNSNFQSGAGGGCSVASVAAAGALKISNSDLNGYSITVAAMPASTAWLTATGYSVGNYVTSKGNYWSVLNAPCTSGASAPTGTSSNYNDGGCRWAYTPMNCFNVVVDGQSPNCTPLATTSACTPGMVSYDASNYFYYCVALNTWGRQFYTDFSGNAAVAGTLGVTGMTTVTGGLSLNQIAISPTQPTVASGFCTSPVLTQYNGTFAFKLNVGTGCAASSGVITMPAAARGWTCKFNNVLHNSANDPEMSTFTPTSITITNYARTTGVASNFTDNDQITAQCRGW